MTVPLKRLDRPRSLYRSVLGSIKNYILENKLQPGDPLPPENELARQLGVSRNSVREAAKALESLGILEARHGSGLFVRGFSFDPLLENLPYGLLFDLHQMVDLLEVRRVLETGMIGTALRGASAEQVMGLQQLVEKMRARAEQEQTFIEEDREFHRKLFENLDNQILLKILDSFWLVFQITSDYVSIWDTDPMRTYRNHAAILDAIRARDVEQARIALERHYDDLEGRLERAQKER